MAVPMASQLLCRFFMTTDHDLAGLNVLWSDSILPERLPTRPTTPEQRLVRAVLEDAVDVVLDPRPHGRRGRVLLAQTEHWLSSNEVQGPYSFVNVCHALAVDPGSLRGRLRSLRAAVGRLRPAA